MKRPLALVIFVAAVLAVFLVLVFWGGKGREYDPDETLRIPLNDNPKSLDPVRATGPYADGVVKRIFNGLVRHAPDLSIAPDLAESWTTSQDGKTYTFRLRKGIKFQNGRELVAADVVYSLTRLADPRVSRKRELVVDVLGAVEYGELAKGKETEKLPEKLSGLSAPDDHTVEIKLRRPWPPFLHLLTMSPASVVPREEVERLGEDFARMPVGTGPFRLVSYKPDDRIVLERFDEHFAGRPALAAVIYHIIDDPGVRLQSYLNGELDMTDIPLGRLPEFVSRADHHSWAELDTYYLGISQLKAPYGKSVHLRRALNHAIDRRRLCGRVLEGRAVPAKGVLPPGMPGYDEKRRGYSFDLKAAERELAAAGYPGGKGLPAVPLYHKPSSDARAIVVELQQQLARAGIPVELSPVDLARIKEMTIKEPPALFFLSWIGDYPDPENFLYVLFHSTRKGPTNRVHYSSREADGLLKRARSLPDGPERLAAYGKVEERVVADAPWVFLYHRSAHLLINPRVRGLTFTTLDTGTELPQADFVKVRRVKEE